MDGDVSNTFHAYKSTLISVVPLVTRKSVPPRLFCTARRSTRGVKIHLCTFPYYEMPIPPTQSHSAARGGDPFFCGHFGRLCDVRCGAGHAYAWRTKLRTMSMSGPDLGPAITFIVP